MINLGFHSLFLSSDFGFFSSLFFRRDGSTLHRRIRIVLGVRIEHAREVHNKKKTSSLKKCRRDARCTRSRSDGTDASVSVVDKRRPLSGPLLPPPLVLL